MPVPASFPRQARASIPFAFTLVGVPTPRRHRHVDGYLSRRDERVERSRRGAAARRVQEGGGGSGGQGDRDRRDRQGVHRGRRHPVSSCGTSNRDRSSASSISRGGPGAPPRHRPCAKPVVARLHGFALGGGLELALACHAISPRRARLAFPETGIGIYPGFRRDARTPRGIGVGLTQVAGFHRPDAVAEEALAIGFDR